MGMQRTPVRGMWYTESSLNGSREEGGYGAMEGEVFGEWRCYE